MKQWWSRLVVGFGVGLLMAAAQAADPTPADIDKVFAAWDKPDSPGAALVVVRDGKIAYRRGYGQANLEHNVPITPTTVQPPPETPTVPVIAPVVPEEG